MANAEEPELIVCMKVEDGPYIVPGAGVKNCHLCNAEIWVSPSSADVKERHPQFQYTCLSCAFEEAKDYDGEIKVMPLTDFQKQEIEEAQQKDKKWMP